MSRDDEYEFRLVAAASQPPIAIDNWRKIWWLIVHMQPARQATLDGDPPRAIRVIGADGTEVASALLARLERLAMTSLTVEIKNQAGLRR